MMKGFDQYNPLVITIYFFSVTGVAMFGSHPLFMTICLVGGVSYFLLRNGRKHAGSHLYFLLLFLILSAVNPITSHNGKTVLLVINDAPITLEALFYGLNSAAMAVGAIYWFRSFSQIMTSDKLLYITGRFSPNISLIISMTLRFIPLFGRQMKKTAEAQKAMGLFKDDNIIDSIKGWVRIFSIVITWALENSLVTAASMEARGCGTAKRTSFSDLRFSAADAALLSADLLLLCICVIGYPNFEFYPEIKQTEYGFLEICSVFAYFVMALMPIIIETRANLKWKFLKSKI